MTVVEPVTDPRLRDFAAHVRNYAILALDAQGRVCTWNDGARRVKGYEPAEIIGARYERFFPPADVAVGRPAEVLARARADGEYEEEGWRLRKDGSSFWAHVVIQAIVDDRGELIGYGKITEDLTERRERDAELQARMDELARSNAELEKFAYVTSHDLSEPLRSISGYADVLRRRYADDLGDGERYLGKIIDSSARMRILIDDLLAYSRAGRRGMEVSEVDLSMVVADAVEQLAAAVGKADAVIEVGDLPRVRADRMLVSQVVQNLVANALKFSEGRPHVEITGETRDETVALLVADRGIGIEPQYAERVFELFQRLHAYDEYPGTGVGLAIGRRIAERHGGDLTFAARAGGGTVFTLTLGADPEEAGA